MALTPALTGVSVNNDGPVSVLGCCCTFPEDLGCATLRCTALRHGPPRGCASDVPHGFAPCSVAPRNVAPCSAMPRSSLSCGATPCSTAPRSATPRYATPCCALPCSASLQCCILRYCDLLCYSMPCFVVLRHALPRFSMVCPVCRSSGRLFCDICPLRCVTLCCLRHSAAPSGLFSGAVPQPRATLRLCRSCVAFSPFCSSLWRASLLLRFVACCYASLRVFLC